jgi:AcrR family transcriptional regulator
MEGVKRGGRRAEQRKATRARIVQAATDLFIRKGYAATTLEQIGVQADVAVQTVYFHFGNKRTILNKAINILAVGDDEPVAMIDRPLAQQALHEADAGRAIAIWVDNGRAISERVAPLLRVLRDAVGADPDMAPQWEVNQQQRLSDHRAFAAHLADLHALKAGISAELAADMIYALNSPEMYQVLTAERGWTPAQWATWTTDALTRALLPGEAARA